MTKREFEETIDAIHAARDKGAVSKKAALAYLKKVGLVDANGNLTVEYRKAKAKIVMPNREGRAA